MAIADSEKRFLGGVDRLEQYMVGQIRGMVRMKSENPPGDES